jgi:hypothetical protein
MPEKITTAKSVTCDGNPVEFVTSKIEDSVYTDFNLILDKVHLITIKY